MVFYIMFQTGSMRRWCKQHKLCFRSYCVIISNPSVNTYDLRELASQLASSACWHQVVETTDAHGAKPSVPMTTNQLCRQWPYRSLI